MQFLQESLVELITQTATNLPPDVRQAMGIAIAAETPHTQASQALGIIATNIDMAAGDQEGDPRGRGRSDQARQAAAQLGRFPHRQE
jgi:hypothetical protein